MRKEGKIEKKKEKRKKRKERRRKKRERKKERKKKRVMEHQKAGKICQDIQLNPAIPNPRVTEIRQ